MWETMSHNIKLNIILSLLLVITVSTKAERSRKSTEVSFAKQQLQFLSLYNNLNFCLRDTDTALKDASASFDPLKNLNLYKNPETVKSYFEDLKAGNFGGRFQPFVFSDAFIGEMDRFLKILWQMDDWELFFNTTAYASQRMNTQLFYATMNVLLPSKWRHFKSPVSAEVDKGNPENGMRYWRQDPGLNQFHFQWHASFPTWFSGVGFKKDRKGELLLHAHHNIVVRAKAERLSNGMGDIEELSITKPIPVGHIPFSLNVDLTELPARKRNSVMGNGSEDLLNWQDRLLKGIEDGYLISASGVQVSLRNESGNDYFGSTIWSSAESVNRKYYGKLHTQTHFVISNIGQRSPTNPGVQFHADLAMSDPVFYMIHAYVDKLNRLQQYQLPPYTMKDLEFPEVSVNSVKITSNRLGSDGTVPILITFFEKYSYDISNALTSCKKVNSDKAYTATITRLNHEPFEYKISAYNRGSIGSRGIVRIFMAPANGFDGKRLSREELYWNMFEMDRFPLNLQPGLNVISRSSLESSVSIKTAQGFKELIEEAKNEQLSPYPLNETRNCGWPQNLLLPRGTKEGMDFKLFLMISSNSTGDYDETEFPKLPYCGNPNGEFPDKVPMGFPFNRRYPTGSSVELESLDNSMFTDVIIIHLPGSP